MYNWTDFPKTLLLYHFLHYKPTRISHHLQNKALSLLGSLVRALQSVLHQKFLSLSPLALKANWHLNSPSFFFVSCLLTPIRPSHVCLALPPATVLLAFREICPHWAPRAHAGAHWGPPTPTRCSFLPRVRLPAPP